MAPATLGFEGFLQNRPAGEQVVAATVAVVLVIEGDQLRTLLADSDSLVEGLFRTLLDAGRLPLQHIARAGAVPAPTPGDTAAPSLLETVTILQQVPLLADVSAEDALSLAAIARYRVTQPGEVVSRHDEPPAVCILLSGEMSLEVSGCVDVSPITAHAGDVVGLFETLANLPVGRSQRVVRHTRFLRIAREDLFDLTGQHPTLPECMLSTLFEHLSETTARSRPEISSMP